MENGELFRVEHDTMGEVRVPADHLWGAQTQRSFQNLPSARRPCRRGSSGPLPF